MAVRSLMCLSALTWLACGDSSGPAIPEVAPALAAHAEPEPTPAPTSGLTVTPIPELSPFTPDRVARLRQIRATSDRRYDDVFMKVGDSSTVSRGFLECLSNPARVDLGAHHALQPTIAYFRNRHAGGRDSFRRASRAAAVGWSTRHVLNGRPPPLLAELAAIRPRFAFVMNGGNDVEGRDDYRYAQRLLRVVTLLERNGVIPILNSLAPRPHEPEADAWVRRYNQISWAIATARGLPYLNYHAVMSRLPRYGLAGDGVHPNIYPLQHRGNACVFDEAGLQFGHNARNLLALRGLDALRRTVIEGEPAPDPAPPRLEGTGTVASPFEVRALPFADLRDTRTEGSAQIERYRGAEQDESGREIVYRLVVDHETDIRLLAVGADDVDVDVHLCRAEPTGDACVRRADRQIEATLEPGVWFVTVDTFSDAAGVHAGEALILFAPRIEGTESLD